MGKSLLLLFVFSVTVTALVFPGAEQEAKEEAKAEPDRTVFQHDWDDMRDYLTPADYEVKTGKTIPGYDEAPMLKEMVEKGEILPLEQRLPKEPYVIEPYESIGKYGGTGYTSRSQQRHWDNAIMLALGMEPLFRIASDYKTVVPNVPKAYEYGDGGKTLTIYMREGMRWSDGESVTADDILFWYEDIVLNDELSPNKPSWFSPGGKVGKVVKIDDYTFQFRFDVPFPTAHMITGHSGPGPNLLRAKHYLSQFHPRYVDRDELESMTKKEGYESWAQLFWARRRGWNNHQVILNERPNLLPFLLKSMDANAAVLERNPYYWKVDVEGNQLPYIDRIVVTQVESPEVQQGRAISGEETLFGYGATLENLNLYRQSEESAGTRTRLWDTPVGSMGALMLNQTAKDLVLREIIQDLRFRQALSLAIDRDEINEVLFLGLATPRQATLLPTSQYFEDWYATTYTEYDPDRANGLLDEMGLKWDSNREWRLRPDGKKLDITVDVSVDVGAESGLPFAEILVDHFKDIGVNLVIKANSQDLQYTRSQGNQTEIFLGQVHTVTDMTFLATPGFWVPYSVGWGNPWAVEWSRWVITGGAEGEEPPQEIKNLRTWHDEMLTTQDNDRRIELGKKILSYNAENLFIIGTVGMAPIPLVAKTNLRNLPENGWWGWGYVWTWVQHPETFYLD